ncbi:sensor domain-containing diguanylate cyclase, partial [Escherichia coli]
YLLIFYIVWRFALVISNPLHNLANMASLLNQPKIEERIKRINPWYYEVTKFKLSLLLSARKFSHKLTEMDHRINTDPLTGLLNRRGMQFFTK